MGTKNYYVEYAIGSVSNRFNLCKLNEFYNVIANNPNQEIYRSMFLYDKDIHDHLKETKSIGNYSGIQAVDKLYLDIDLAGEKRGDETIKTVQEVIEHIKSMSIPEDYIQLWFSGRGFHIHLPDVYGFEPSKIVAQKVRSTMERDFGKYIDNIYDKARLIRAGYSLNKKSQCFKLPLPLQSINKWDYDEIKDFAKDFKNLSYKPPKLPVGVSETFKDLKPVDISKKKGKQIMTTFNRSKSKTTNFITCSQHMYNAGYVHGQRHNFLLRIASIWMRHYGHDKAMVQSMARAWNSSLSNPLPSEEVAHVLRGVFDKNGYAYKCSDKILSEYCDSKCTKYRYKNLEETLEASNINEVSNIMAEYYNTDFTGKSFDLKSVFPFMPNSYVFRCGDLAVLQGDTKLGKTAFWQYIIANLTLPTLFLSLEVQTHLMGRRFMQIALQKSKEEIIEYYQNHNTEMIQKAENKLQHIHIIDSSKVPDLSKYGEMIDEYDVKIIVIDTLDPIKAREAPKGGDLTEQIYIINTLKDLAVEKDVIILGVNHISKASHYRATQDGQRLDVYSAKGASDLAQKCDKLISFEGSLDNTRRTISATVSRDEGSFEITTTFDWNTFSFRKRT